MSSTSSSDPPRRLPPSMSHRLSRGSSAAPSHTLFLRVHSAENLSLRTSHGVYCKLYVGASEISSESKSLLNNLMGKTTGENDDDDDDDESSNQANRHRTLRTHTLTKNVTHPVWNEKFQIPLKSSHRDILSIRVKSQNIVKLASVIGACAIHLSKLEVEVGVDKMVPIFHRQRHTGNLRLQFLLREAKPRTGSIASTSSFGSPRQSLSSNHAASGPAMRVMGSMRDGDSENACSRGSSFSSEHQFNNSQPYSTPVRPTPSVGQCSNYYDSGERQRVPQRPEWNANGDQSSACEPALPSFRDSRDRRSFRSAGGSTDRGVFRKSQLVVDVPEIEEEDGASMSIIMRMAAHMERVQGTDDDSDTDEALQKYSHGRKSSRSSSSASFTPPRPSVTQYSDDTHRETSWKNESYPISRTPPVPKSRQSVNSTGSLSSRSTTRSAISNQASVHRENEEDEYSRMMRQIQNAVKDELPSDSSSDEDESDDPDPRKQEVAVQPQHPQVRRHQKASIRSVLSGNGRSKSTSNQSFHSNTSPHSRPLVQSDLMTDSIGTEEYVELDGLRSLSIDPSFEAANPHLGDEDPDVGNQEFYF